MSCVVQNARTHTEQTDIIPMTSNNESTTDVQCEDSRYKVNTYVDINNNASATSTRKSTGKSAAKRGGTSTDAARKDVTASRGRAKNTSLPSAPQPPLSSPCANTSVMSSTSLLHELKGQLMPETGVRAAEDMNFTSFEFDTAEHLMLSVLYMQQDCPDIMSCKTEFLLAMSTAFDKVTTVKSDSEYSHNFLNDP
jgi:hypothetical protein